MGQSGTLNSYEGAAEFYVNGRLMAEAESVKVDLASGDNAVTTMIGGFSGFSDGPTTASIEVSSAPIKNGYEFDFEEAVKAKATIEVVVLNGGKRSQYIGRFTQSSFSASATDKASISGTFMGKPKGMLR